MSDLLITGLFIVIFLCFLFYQNKKEKKREKERQEQKKREEEKERQRVRKINEIKELDNKLKDNIQSAKQGEELRLKNEILGVISQPENLSGMRKYGIRIESEADLQIWLKAEINPPGRIYNINIAIPSLYIDDIQNQKKEQIKRFNRELELSIQRQKVSEERIRQAKNARLQSEKEVKKKEEKKVIQKSYTPYDVEEKEFQLLLKEMRGKNFTLSSEVSNYIIRNQLGYKYQHISGHLKMRNRGGTWDFKGGFPTHIFGRLCEELNLTSKKSEAEVVSFKAFKDIPDNNKYKSSL